MRKLFFVAFLILSIPLVAHAQNTTCGTTSVQSTLATFNNYFLVQQSCTPTASGTVNDCQVYTAATGGNVNCALYDSDGASAKPNTLLCQGTPVAAIAGGWVTIMMSGCPTLSGGHAYYIAVDESVHTLRHGTGSTPITYYYNAGTCCAFSTYAFSTVLSSWSPISAYFDLTSLNVNPPTASYASGTYNNAISDVLTGSGTVICYTLDGSTPSTNGSGACYHGTTYSNALNLPASGTSVTLSAVAGSAGTGDSTVATWTYTFVTAAPAMSPNGGAFSSPQSVSMTSATSGTTIQYCTGLDSCTPSLTYSSAITSVMNSLACANASSTFGTSATTCVAFTHPVTGDAATQIATDNFSAYYNPLYDNGDGANNQTYLDLFTTGGLWKSNGWHRDVVWYNSPNYSIAPRATGGEQCLTSATSNPAGCAYVRAGEGYYTDHQSSVVIPANLGGAVVRCDGADASSERCTYFYQYGTTLRIVSVENGAQTLLASGTASGTGNTLSLRVQGCTYTGYVNGVSTLTAAPSVCYFGGHPGFISSAQGWTGYNVDGSVSGYTPPSLGLQTYTDPMNASGPAVNSRWFNFSASNSAHLTNAWGTGIGYISSSGLWGVISQGSGQMTYRAAFDKQQWDSITVQVLPWNVSNWFLLLENRPTIPGLMDGVCEANSNLPFCFDSASYYVGEQYQLNSGSACAASKDPYACTPFVMADKVTPWSTNATGGAQGANQVQTLAGSTTTAMPGDTILARYTNGYLDVYCKQSATPPAAWPDSGGTGYIEAAGMVWVGNSSSDDGVQPSWPTSASWTINPTTHVGSGTMVHNWQYYGDSCPTQNKFTRIIHVADTDLADPTTIALGYSYPLGNGYPGVFGGCASAGGCTLFSNFAAGSVGVAGDPCLGNGCSVQGAQNVPSWLLP